MIYLSLGQSSNYAHQGKADGQFLQENWLFLALELAHLALKSIRVLYDSVYQNSADLDLGCLGFRKQELYWFPSIFV